MRKLAAALTVLAALVACPSAVAKLPWSASATLDRTLPAGCDLNAELIPAGCFGEPGTRVAVSPEGLVVVVWSDVQQRIKAAVGDRRGRFGRTQMLGSGLRPAVTIDGRGAALVAWTAGQLRVARLAPGMRRFGRSVRLVASAGRSDDDEVRLLARSDGAVAVYASTSVGADGTAQANVATVELGRRAAPSSRHILGPGELLAAAATPAGEPVVCCGKPGGETAAGAPAPPLILFVRRAGAPTWSTLTMQLPQDAAVESLAAGVDTIALGTVAVRNSGDAGTLGRPGAVRGPLAGPFGPVRPAQVDEAGKAFGPVTAIDGAGRTVLAYQEKRISSAFSRDAPLYMVSARAGRAFGARTALDRARVSEPLVQPLGGGAIVAWDRGDRWGVALERRGRVRRIGSPSGGPGELGRDAITNRALATAGSYAALAWEDEAGDIRASVARLAP